MRSRALLAALLLCVLACGHYGPPRRQQPEQTSVSQPDPTEDEERKERDR